MDPFSLIWIVSYLACTSYLGWNVLIRTLSIGLVIYVSMLIWTGKWKTIGQIEPRAGRGPAQSRPAPVRPDPLGGLTESAEPCVGEDEAEIDELFGE